MSPAPQGNPEVEKYIGSYLISQRIPPNIKSSSAKRFQNQPAKQKSQDGEKVRFNKYCYPRGDHARYSIPPGLRAPLPVGSHYEHPGGGWAGVPLISMTSGNHRRNKKVPPTGNAGQIQKYSQKTQQNEYAKGKEEEECRDADRSPLTRLAIHTQGAPLIQAGRYNGNRCKNGFHRDQNRVFRGDSTRWEAAKEVKTQTGVQTPSGGSGGADSASVASDESSGNSENSLPRIIKPRKRRKKDRKPLTSVSATTQNEPAPYTGDQKQKLDTGPLKTYLPHNDSATNSSENNTDLLKENDTVSTIEEKQNDDLIATFTSDEFPFGNLLDDEEDKESELTLCQCRYCDPSGVIWDVDQRCYSPFLTPPSPTDTFLPLAFSPYTRTRYMDTDLNTLLRRSWSDPSSYGKPESFRSSETDRSDSRPSSLQVSSEIVTSPNGHRDIEIKFYSSPPPQEPKVNASERLLVAEE